MIERRAASGAPLLWLANRQPQWVLSMMLLALHAALAWDIDAWWARALWLTHIGLFLIWQPLWRAQRRIDPRSGLALVAAGVGFALLATWWLAALWICVLFALIAGQVPGTGEPRERAGTLLASSFLLGLLLLWVVPRLGPGGALPELLTVVVQFMLPLVALAAGAIRPHPPAQKPAAQQVHVPVVIDLVYSMLLLLLVAVLVLGSLVLGSVRGEANHLLTLAQALIAIAALLVVLSWLWNPRGGFGGLNQVISGHLLSVGLPFENWMRSLALLAERQRDPERFLRGAIAELSRLPWAAGVCWKAVGSTGTLGVVTRHRIELSARGLSLELYTQMQPTPALNLHATLLAQLLGDFYDAKRRELRERKHAYEHAIHETGARLTHDVKNLLQSLQVLCAAVESSDAARAVELQALMRRQLPQIAQRLERTLDKLARPQVRTMTQVDAGQWWRALRRRVDQDGVRLSSRGALDGSLLPLELFDCAVDNLLQNSWVKRQLDPAVSVHIELSVLDGVQLSVTDTGAAVEPSIAERLLVEPVESRNGLGVGLYQAARLALEHGFELQLSSNQAGAVRFTLKPAR
ncbi:MAG: ATP-binding protein [bacterium]